MLQWKDTTNFSRSDTDRTPRSWSANAGAINLTVTRHIHCPGTWIALCGVFSGSSHDLRTDDVNEAKVKAVQMLSTILRDALAALD